MLKIGNVKICSRLILAPMAGVSDFPFRMLNRKFGCEFAFLEMLNSRSVKYKSRRTQVLLATGQSDRPLGVQLLGCETEFVLNAMEVLHNYKFDILDFNAACPSKKVVRRGEGASLLKSPKKLYNLLRIIVKESQIPVTVKIRTGWDSNSVNAEEAAEAAEDAGVSCVFIHGRTRVQGYSGKVDYRQIREVKKALHIPVVASGDIFSAPLAKKMFDETGCDGLIIARGALGNPWIFKEISGFLKDGSCVHKPALEEIITVMHEHLNMCVDFYGETNGIIIFRKFFIWYTKGLRKVRHLREEANKVKTRDAMAGIIERSCACRLHEQYT